MLESDQSTGLGAGEQRRGGRRRNVRRPTCTREGRTRCLPPAAGPHLRGDDQRDEGGLQEVPGGDWLEDPSD